MKEYKHHQNTNRFSPSTKATATKCTHNLSNWNTATNEIQNWPEYQPQPLHDLNGFANQLGLSKVYIKDESRRFGVDMASFKALGAPYAVYRILAKAVLLAVGVEPSSEQLRAGVCGEITRRVTVCVATDGNQGRGLAYGAKVFGCRCVNYVHRGVSSGRVRRMRDLGATVVRVDGEYEVSVERAREDARVNGWWFISSTSWTDFDQDVSRYVMNAYMVVVEEALSMLPTDKGEEVTHVFVCGGVGSIAAAVFLGFFERYRLSNRAVPRFVVVEPTEADCLLQSAQKGDACPSKGSLQTLMAGLACRGPSLAALKILLWLASDFIAVPDSVAVEGMKALASGGSHSIPVVCGESSAASMGILLATEKNAKLRTELGLDGNSRVLMFGLEGATDPDIYERLVGVSPDAVFDAQARFLPNAL